MARTTINTFRKHKESGEKLVMVTAYDAQSSAMAADAGIDALLVGDSLANAVLGYRNTLPLTMEQSLHHAKAVRRGAPDSFVVFDMPFMSYQESLEKALHNAGLGLKEADSDAVKLEGGAAQAPLIEQLVKIGIPVMAHIGLLPQSVSTSGGYRVQGRSEEAARQILVDAKRVESAGAFAVVLECIPAPLAAEITHQLQIPTIGIGAGAGCDGQIQVLNDILGICQGFVPRHTKHYAEVGQIARTALAQYAAEVRGGTFPDREHCFE